VFYKFDALGRRVARTANSATTIYFQSGQQTIADYASGAAASSPAYSYIYASYVDEPAARFDGSGASLFMHRNQQYSITAITAITDGSGAISEHYAYSAYGTPTITNGSESVIAMSVNGNRYTYTGREWDEKLSLYHYRARMYDNVTGRFVSRDPIGYGDGPSTYLYGGGMPTLFIDPTGFASCTDEKCSSGPWSGRDEGFYYAKAEVVGSRCFGGAGGCCTVGGGNAYLVLTFVETHSVLDQPANGELELELGQVRFGDIVNRGCSLLKNVTRNADGGWTISATASCPIACDSSCKCSDPFAMLGVYSTYHRLIDPKNGPGKNDSGFATFSAQLNASATLFDKKAPCSFGGCSVSFNVSWDFAGLIENQLPKTKPHSACKHLLPAPELQATDPAAYNRQYESYLRCTGFRRPRRPWVVGAFGIPCTGSKYEEAKGIVP